MVKLSKRTKTFESIVEKDKLYELSDAITALKSSPQTKFDQTIEVSVKLGVDPKQSSQSVRGTVSLPHGTGKSVRVAVFCKGEDQTTAKESGADYYGGDELINKVAGGWCDFDVAIATPVMMREMGKIGKVLGPRGLMPNPKAGTVTTDIPKAINEVKAGKIEFKMDKQGNVNCGCGKLSFEDKALADNVKAFIDTLAKAKPAVAKGQFIKNVVLSSTMGPGIKLDVSNWRS